MTTVAENRPRFEPEEALQLAQGLYGLRVSANELPSERDQNFLLSDESPRPDQAAFKERPAAPAPSGEAKVDQPAAVPQQTEVSPPPGTAPASAPAQPAEVKPAASQSNKLEIQASELTWISITEDENQSYQIMLRPGDNLERVAGRFVIDIGNAGGISLNLNGEDLGVPGQRGQVVHLILPREKPPE